MIAVREMDVAGTVCSTFFSEIWWEKCRLIIDVWFFKSASKSGYVFMKRVRDAFARRLE